jgi:hypothetical protein
MSRWETDPVYAANDIAGKLQRNGVKLPKPVAEAYAIFAAIEIPTDVDPDAVAMAIATGKSVDVVDALLLDAVLRPQRRAAATRAKEIAAVKFLSAIRTHADEIHEQLRPAAEHLISEIEQAARIGDISLTELVRTGREADARRYAELPSDLTRLSDLYRLRNNIWSVNQLAVNGIDCSEFYDLISYTSPVQLSDRQSDAAKQHSLWARGARRWFPTPAEWQSRAEELLPKHEAEQQQIERAQRASFA